MNFSYKLKLLPISLGVIVIGLGSVWMWIRYQQAETIQQAKTLAIFSEDENLSLKQLEEEKQNLEQAIALMESIPELPGTFYEEAQAQKQQFHTQLTALKEKREKKASYSLKEAVELNLQAEALLKTEPKSLKTLRESQEKLEKAVIILREMPPDSSVAPEVQKLKANYELQQKLAADKLDNEYKAKASLEVVKIKVLKATKLTENLPQPVAIWLQASNEWAEIIKQLEAIPKDTTYRADIDNNLKIYRENYQITQKGLEKEVMGEQNLKLAQQLADEANKSTVNSPQDLKEWLEIEEKWLKVMDLLNNIPPETTAREVAKNIQEEYEIKLYTVRNAKKEVIKQNHYAELSAVINRLIDFENNESNNFEEYRVKINEFYPIITQLSQEPYIQELRSYKYLIDAYNNYQDVARSLTELTTIYQQINQLSEQENELNLNLSNLNDTEILNSMEEISNLRIEKARQRSRAEYLLNLAKQSSRSARANLIRARDNL